MSFQWLLPYIHSKGAITVAEYMELCLYHPEHGYYTTHNPIGAEGDFITAPEVSQMFGEMIGVCFMDLWIRMGKPGKVHLIEMGPGQGTLMADLLRILRPEMRSALDIHLVEISPALTQIQQQRLPGEVSWHKNLDEVLNACDRGPVFMVANELFDAFPIEQRVKTPQGWQERQIRVAEDGESLEFIPTPDPDQIIREFCPQAREVTAKIAACLQKTQGVALFIDYGYLGPAQGDTLQALRHHQFHPILLAPGQADLTAHVDFSELEKAAKEAGAHVYGPTTQGAFLSEMGIGLRAEGLRKHAGPRDLAQIDRALHRLLDPSQMGNLFKVMAMTGPQTPQPSGFEQCIKAAS